MYTQVLQYHVVPNQALKAAQLTNGQLLASELQNQPVKVGSRLVSIVNTTGSCRSLVCKMSGN